MATIMDVSLIKSFGAVFPFLFIFAVVYGFLSYRKVFGDNRALHAIIAVIFALMSLLSSTVIETINRAAPWFVLLMIFIVFLLLGFMILGAGEADILAVIKSSDYSFINWWIFFLVLAIVLGSLSQVISEKGGYPPYGEGENATVSEGGDGGQVPKQESDFWQTIFHPKVLGLIAILLIAFFTVSKLTYEK
ncbi:hypothetical protein JW707_00115 [Candidatus Woesearchaeota archaeon]|nr:hypothetical protein [Candidatus Woesearchaeota archaeon]